jgi:transposase
MAFIRKVKTKSGATAIQIAHKVHGRIVKLEHLGSAHNPEELTSLTELAQHKLIGSQISLFPKIQPTFTVQLKQAYSHLLWQELHNQYCQLGFNQIDDAVFASLCIARLVEPTSKLDSLRVLADLGITSLDKNQLYRCLKKVIDQDYRQIISQLCFNRVAQQGLSLLLYDVTTLYFEVQREDDYRKPGLSKERRLEPQIVIGLLVDQTGFPLSLHSFSGNTAETKTIIPVLEAFRIKHHLPKITVVADAAMMSIGNLNALSQSDYTYIVASRLTKIPYEIANYQKTQTLVDKQIIVDQRDDFKIIYQYRTKRATLDMRNIEKQITKAQRIISGKSPAHKAKFVTVKTKTKILNHKLIEKAYALAGIKGYVTNLDIPDQQVIDSYHQLFQVEASFRMAKSDLKARPIFHRKQDAIEAHLTIVLAAIALGRTIEAKTGTSIRHLIKTLRTIRSGTVLINGREYPAKEVIPSNVQLILKKLHSGH